MFRNATIKAKEPTHLACMDRVSYTKTLKVLEERKLSEVLEFLHSLPFFTNWSNTALTKVKYNFVLKDCIRNTIVYKQGDLPSKVYVIVQGEFRETCRIPLCQIKEELFPLLSEEVKEKLGAQRYLNRNRLCIQPPMRIVDVNFLND